MLSTFTRPTTVCLAAIASFSPSGGPATFAGPETVAASSPPAGCRTISALESAPGGTSTASLDDLPSGPEATDSAVRDVPGSGDGDLTRTSRLGRDSMTLLPGRVLIRANELGRTGEAFELESEGLAASGWLTVRVRHPGIEMDHVSGTASTVQRPERVPGAGERDGERAGDARAGREGPRGPAGDTSSPAWARLARRDGITFASPVLVDANGDLRAATSRLVVAFEATLPWAEALSWLRETNAGEAIELDALGLPGMAIVETGRSHGEEVWELAERVARHPAVRFAEPHCLLSASPHRGDAPLVADCWGLENTGQDLDFCGQLGGIDGLDMRAGLAWETTLGDPSVVVVVLDNGVAFDHPDLAASAGPGFDATGAGGGGGPVGDCDNHGTAVAGCIVAAVENGGVVGLAPGATVASARISTVSPSCNTWTVDPIWVADALTWAVSIGARITNTSWRFGESALIAEAYAATAEAGLLHVASAGNGGIASVDFPASLPEVVAVGAMTRWGSVASFSNRGDELEFVAPGQVVVCPDRVGASGYRLGDYVCLDGTSFASPFVAATAALMLSTAPELGPAQVRTLLRTAVRDLGAVGWDAIHGWGLPQADLAIAAATKPADLDRNGIVHATDLAMMLAMWGLEGPLGDLDGDGVVGAADLAMLLAMWDG